MNFKEMEKIQKEIGSLLRKKNQMHRDENTVKIDITGFGIISLMLQRNKWK